MNLSIVIMKRASICAGINSTTYSALNIAGTGLNAGRVWVFLPHHIPHAINDSFKNVFVAKESATETHSRELSVTWCKSARLHANRVSLSHIGHLHLILHRSYLGPKCLSGKVFRITVYNWLGYAASCFYSGSCYFISIQHTSSSLYCPVCKRYTLTLLYCNRNARTLG